MKEQLFEDIDTDSEGLPLMPPKRQDMYIIIAYLATKGYWDMPGCFRKTFSSKEYAIEAANLLPKCWIYRRIVRIPGEQ